MWVAHDITERKQAEQALRRRVDRDGGAVPDLDGDPGRGATCRAADGDRRARRSADGRRSRRAVPADGGWHPDSHARQPQHGARLHRHRARDGRRGLRPGQPRNAGRSWSRTTSAWEGRSPKFAGSGVGRVLAVPMLVGERLIGVLNVADSSTGSYGEDDIRLASLFADQAAMAIESARLVNETNRRAAYLEALTNTAAALRAAVLPKEMYADVWTRWSISSRPTVRPGAAGSGERRDRSRAGGGCLAGDDGDAPVPRPGDRRHGDVERAGLRQRRYTRRCAPGAAGAAPGPAGHRLRAVDGGESDRRLRDGRATRAAERRGGAAADRPGGDRRQCDLPRPGDGDARGACPAADAGAGGGQRTTAGARPAEDRVRVQRHARAAHADHQRAAVPGPGAARRRPSPSAPTTSTCSSRSWSAGNADRVGADAVAAGARHGADGPRAAPAGRAAGRCAGRPSGAGGGQGNRARTTNRTPGCRSCRSTGCRCTRC